jgi:hypothetical protein
MAVPPVRRSNFATACTISVAANSGRSGYGSPQLPAAWRSLTLGSETRLLRIPHIPIAVPREADHPRPRDEAGVCCFDCFGFVVKFAAALRMDSASPELTFFTSVITVFVNRPGCRRDRRRGCRLTDVRDAQLHDLQVAGLYVPGGFTISDRRGPT